MVYDYLVTIKNDKGKHVNTISLLICFVSAVFFLNQQIKTGSRSLILLIPFCLIIIGLVWNGYIFVKKKQPVAYRRLLLVAGATWFIMPFLQWVGVPIILLSLLEKHARSPLEIGITKDRIVINSLYRRKFTWNELNNVMLKDGMLTLDFKNNRLFQKELAEETTPEIENELNEYCNRNLRDLTS